MTSSHCCCCCRALTRPASLVGAPLQRPHTPALAALSPHPAARHKQHAGITILDGDCYADVAANTTLKLLHLLQQPDIPVAVSTLPAVSPFPAAYRSQGLILDVLPILNRHSPADLAALHNRHLQQVPGQEVFAQLLLQQTDKVTIVATGEFTTRPGAAIKPCTAGRLQACFTFDCQNNTRRVSTHPAGHAHAGPLSNLAYALDTYPQLAGRIQQVWWMGGALRVRGNVYEPGSDGSAEWNAYWDPAALASVWRSSVPLTLVPLDGTNKVRRCSRAARHVELHHSMCRHRPCDCAIAVDSGCPCNPFSRLIGCHAYACTHLQVPITPDLVYSFGPQADYLFSALAGTFYAPVVNWVYSTPGDPYYACEFRTVLAGCTQEGRPCCGDAVCRLVGWWWEAKAPYINADAASLCGDCRGCPHSRMHDGPAALQGEACVDAAGKCLACVSLACTTEPIHLLVDVLDERLQ